MKRLSVLALPIKDPSEKIVGVFEIVGYKLEETDLEDRFLADYCSYAAGILISDYR